MLFLDAYYTIIFSIIYINYKFFFIIQSQFIDDLGNITISSMIRPRSAATATSSSSAANLFPYLTLHRQWKYKLLPMSGISSLAYVGPSATLCAAGGNVWFDPSTHVNNYATTTTACMTREAVRTLRVLDNPNANHPNFDWKYFEQTQHRMCLRQNYY